MTKNEKRRKLKSSAVPVSQRFLVAYGPHSHGKRLPIYDVTGLVTRSSVEAGTVLATAIFTSNHRNIALKKKIIT